MRRLLCAVRGCCIVMHEKRIGPAGVVFKKIVGGVGGVACVFCVFERGGGLEACAAVVADDAAMLGPRAGAGPHAADVGAARADRAVA